MGVRTMAEVVVTDTTDKPAYRLRRDEDGLVSVEHMRVSLHPPRVTVADLREALDQLTR